MTTKEPNSEIIITQDDIEMCEEIMDALKKKSFNDTNIKRFSEWYIKFIKSNIEKIVKLDAETRNAICEKINEFAKQIGIDAELPRGIEQIIFKNRVDVRPRFKTGGSRKINKSARKNRSRKYKQTGGMLPLAAILVIGVLGMIAIVFCSAAMWSKLNITATKTHIYFGTIVCIPFHAIHASLWFANQMKTFYNNRQNRKVNPVIETFVAKNDYTPDIATNDHLAFKTGDTIELIKDKAHDNSPEGFEWGRIKDENLIALVPMTSVEDVKLEDFKLEDKETVGEDKFGGSKSHKQIKNRSKKLKRYKKSRLA